MREPIVTGVSGPRPEAAEPPGPYDRLPERFRPEDMISEQAASDPAEPTLNGRDPNWAWAIKYG